MASIAEARAVREVVGLIRYPRGSVSSVPAGPQYAMDSSSSPT